MSINEFYDWIKYANKEPFFADRLEMQLAQLSTMVASFGKSKATVKDFMIVKNESKKMSTKQLEDNLKMRFGNKRK